MPSRKFRLEGTISYREFKFGYTNWLELESSVELAEAYTEGYLPYSGNTDDPRHLFYMARSLRVSLENLLLDKSRRYDHRQWSKFGLSRRLVAKEDLMRTHGDRLLELAGKWMEPRFGEAALAMGRLKYILDKPFVTDFLVWERGAELTAFALIVRGDWGAHYYYVFYENGAGLDCAPGHGYLVDFLNWAQDAQLPHAYIGTAYGGKSRYKSRGLSGVEFWNGNDWDSNKAELGRLQDLDDTN